MEEKEEEKRFSLFRRRSTKKDLKQYSGGGAGVGARLATANERSATLPSQSSAQAANQAAMTQSPSGGLFSKLKRKFRLRSSRGKYDFKDYDRPQRFRRKSDDPSRSEDQSDISEENNLMRVTSSVKTPRRAQSDKENVILIRKDKCVSVICQDENGGAEVIFSNMPSTEDNSDSISESWEEGGEEDPYATINSVKEEIQERFLSNGKETSKSKSDADRKREKDRARAKELLQYSVASSANASAASTPTTNGGVSNGKPSKIECVNVEDLYAKIDSKNKTRTSVSSPVTPPKEEIQKDDPEIQRCEELNKFVDAQLRCRQDHEYETLEDVRMRASQLFDQSDLTSPNNHSSSVGGDNDTGNGTLDTSAGSCEFEIEPDYETLEDVRQRVSVVLSSPTPKGEAAYDQNPLEGPASPSPSLSKISNNFLEAQSTSISTSTPSPTKSPPPMAAPLAPSIDVEMSPDRTSKDSSSSPTSSDCIYDNPNVILRKQFFRHSMGLNLSPNNRQTFTVLDSSSGTTRKSTQEEEDLIEKLSSQLAPPLPLRMYQKEEVGGTVKGRGGAGSRHSWSSQSTASKAWDMSGSWHAGMEGTTRLGQEAGGESTGEKCGVVRSKSQEIFDEAKEDNLVESNMGALEMEIRESERDMEFHTLGHGKGNQYDEVPQCGGDEGNVSQDVEDSLEISNNSNSDDRMKQVDEWNSLQSEEIENGIVKLKAGIQCPEDDNKRADSSVIDNSQRYADATSIHQGLAAIEQNENILPVLCSDNVDTISTNPSHAKSPSALRTSSPQRSSKELHHCVSEDNEVYDSTQNNGTHEEESKSHDPDRSMDDQTAKISHDESSNPPAQINFCSSSSSNDSFSASPNQNSVDGVCHKGVSNDVDDININKGNVALRQKQGSSAIGSSEWKMKRKSGPNASTTQDIVEMAMAFEHGEFLSGFTEQYNVEEDMEEDEEIMKGDGEANDDNVKGTLLPMSEIMSFPSSYPTGNLLMDGGVVGRRAPICGCEDFDDCGCEEGWDFNKTREDSNDTNTNSNTNTNTQMCVVVTEKNSIANSHTADQRALISHLKESRAGELSNVCLSTGHHNTTHHSVTDKDISRNDTTRNKSDGNVKDSNSDKNVTKKEKDNDCGDNDMPSYPESSHFTPSNSPNAIGAIRRCPSQSREDIPWENFICPTLYKSLNSSLYSLSSHLANGPVEPVSQCIAPQHDDNQKLFLHMMRLLENSINGFCQHWMAIELSYVMTGIFKWARLFHLAPDELGIVDRKLKNILMRERDALFYKWNVVPNKFYEKRREKFQDDVEGIYQKIRTILATAEGLPTFQNVRSNLLGSFLLQYEVKPPFSPFSLVEQEALRISQEDLALWMQTLSSDSWTDGWEGGMDSSMMTSASGSNDPMMLNSFCCDAAVSVSQGQNQNTAMQIIPLNPSCRISPQGDFSGPLNASNNMSPSTSASDFSPGETETEKESKKIISSPSKTGKSGILNEFLTMCDSVDSNDDLSDEEDENETVSTYIKTVAYSNDTDHPDIASVNDAAAILSLCRVFQGEIAYLTRVRKPKTRKDKALGLPVCVDKRNHLSNSTWQEMDHLMKKLIPPMSPRLDFQFLLRTYAEFKFFILKERQRRKNSRCFGRHCFQIETEDGPRCCRKEEMTFMKLIRDELHQFASVIRRSSASESLFVEDRQVSYSLTRLLGITVSTLFRMKNSGRTLSSSSKSSVLSSRSLEEIKKVEAGLTNNDDDDDDDDERSRSGMVVGDQLPKCEVSIFIHSSESTLNGGCNGVSNQPATTSRLESVVIDDVDEDKSDEDFTEDDGKEKCCMTPREKAEFHIENYRSFRAGCMWSDLDAWQSPDAFLDDPNILDRKMGSSFCVDRDTNATLHSHTTWGHYEELKPLQERDDFLESMQQLQLKDWYWGPLSYEQAASVLNNYDDGSFLVRDSSDRKYLLSLSFKSLGEVYHTRIEHAKGLFSFWSQPDSHGKARICEFIEKSVQNSHDGKFLYFLSPVNHGNPPLPVRLLTPVSRNASIPSLRHLSRFVIRQHVRRDLIEFLPVPRMVKAYLRQKQFYVEMKGRWLGEGNTASNTL